MMGGGGAAGDRRFKAEALPLDEEGSERVVEVVGC